MKVDTYQCDVCSVQKKDANHWWRGYPLLAGGVVVVPWSSKPTAEEVSGDEAHLCGENHAIEWVSKKLSAAAGILKG